MEEILPSGHVSCDGKGNELIDSRVDAEKAVVVDPDVKVVTLQAPQPRDAVENEVLIHPELPSVEQIQLSREQRHESVLQLSFRTRLKQGKVRQRVSFQTSSRISYSKEEYMFAKYIKQDVNKVEVEVKEDEVEDKRSVTNTPSEQQNDITNDDSNYDFTPNDDDDDDIRAFPTIKDVAEFEAKKTEELWNRVESENFDFTNFKKDEEDAPLSNTRKVGKKVKRNSVVVKVEGDNIKEALLESFPESKQDQLFTKKGTIRTRSHRKDTKRFLPEVNPIFKESRNPPRTLEDYLVIKSVQAKRYKYESDLTPEERFIAKQKLVSDEDQDGLDGPLSRHIYGCLFCNFMGAKKNWLKHLKNKHRDVPGLIFCTYTRFCNMPFEHEADLEAHVGQVHTTHDQTGPKSTSVLLYERTDVKPDPDPDQQKFSPTKTSGLFYCMFCDYSHSKRNWVHHLKTKHKDKDLHFCQSNKQCNLIFESEEKLDSHVLAMHSSHQCSTCGQEFKQASVLREHRKVHEDEPSEPCYVCTFCGKKYRTRKGCREHEALRHAQHKLRHRCDHVDPGKGGEKCTAAFYSAKELVVHKRKHTGELPFICGYCGNRYISKATLVQHERTRHLETENVECEICHKKLKKRNLPFHVKRHEGFVSVPCKYCGKTFSSVGARNRHEKIHTQDKQFECSYCGKAFVQKSNLQSHERIHTGERPYTCKHCGEGFMQHTRRNVHQLSCRAQPMPAPATQVPQAPPVEGLHIAQQPQQVQQHL